MKKLSIVLVSALLAFPFSCAKKEVPQVLAQVTFIVGEAFQLKNNDWAPLQMGGSLRENDRIKTAPEASVDIQIGESLVRVKESSEVTLARMYKNSETGLEENTLDLAVGTLLAKPKKLAKGDSFSVKTPTAVAGVRGTMFVVEADPARDTTIKVMDGKVQVAKRIPALESIQDSTVKDSEVIKKLEEQVEKSAVTVTENKECKVEAKAVDETNKKVEKIVDKVEKVEKAQVTEEKKTEMKKELQQEFQQAETAKVIEEVASQKSIKTAEIKETPANKELKKEFETIKVAEPVKPVVVEQKVVKSELRLKANPGNASIFVNGEMAGTGEIKMELKPGTYTVKIQAEGYQDAQYEYEIKSGETLEKLVALQRPLPLNRLRWNLDVRETVTSVIYWGMDVISATNKGMLAAINRVTAVKRWERDMGSPISSGIIADGNVLYFATADENLHAVATYDGQVLWTQKLEGAIINNMVPVVTPLEVLAATARGNVYSINKYGAVNWTSKLDAGVYETPMLANGTLFVSGADGMLYALNAANGRQNWAADMGSKFKFVFANNVIYAVSYYGAVSGLSAVNGSVLWKKEAGESVAVQPLVLYDRIIVAGVKGRVAAFALANGAPLYVSELGAQVRNNMTYTDEAIYVSADKTLYALDRDGRVQWNYATQARINTAASITGNEIYLGLDSGQIISFNRFLVR